MSAIGIDRDNLPVAGERVGDLTPILRKIQENLEWHPAGRVTFHVLLPKREGAILGPRSPTHRGGAPGRGSGPNHSRFVGGPDRAGESTRRRPLGACPPMVKLAALGGRRGFLGAKRLLDLLEHAGAAAGHLHGRHGVDRRCGAAMARKASAAGPSPRVRPDRPNRHPRRRSARAGSGRAAAADLVGEGLAAARAEEGVGLAVIAGERAHVLDHARDPQEELLRPCLRPGSRPSARSRAGVVTMIISVRGSIRARPICTSPVPGGMSMRR